MTVKDIVSTWLKANSFDGLYNPDVPCGCLLDDLAPCEEMHEGCEAGLREDVDEHAVCECDGQGTRHWHVTILTPQGLIAHIEEAKNWVCDCGARPSNDGTWRWNGAQWEHHHGYPLGHVIATRKELQ